jgi:hypothetical protein
VFDGVCTCSRPHRLRVQRIRAQLIKALRDIRAVAIDEPAVASVLEQVFDAADARHQQR